MALPDPSWRIKTRTCPFYLQGRCLFVEACNFLHSSSSRLSPAVSLTQQTPLEGDIVPQPPPTDVSISLTVRSPLRSPRLAGLLLTLKDVIGKDPDDNSLPGDDLGHINSPLCSVLIYSNNQQLHADECRTFMGNSGSMKFSPHVDAVVNSSDSAHKEFASTFLSPVDLAPLDLSSFNQVFSDPPAPERTFFPPDAWTSSSCLLQNPLKSTFGSFSSPHATTSFQVVSPQLSTFVEGSHFWACSEDVWSDHCIDLPEKQEGNKYLTDPDPIEGSEENILLPDDCPGTILKAVAEGESHFPCDLLQKQTSCNSPVNLEDRSSIIEEISFALGDQDEPALHVLCSIDEKRGTSAAESANPSGTFASVDTTLRSKVVRPAGDEESAIPSLGTFPKEEFRLAKNSPFVDFLRLDRMKEESNRRLDTFGFPGKADNDFFAQEVCCGNSNVRNVEVGKASTLLFGHANGEKEEAIKREFSSGAKLLAFPTKNSSVVVNSGSFSEQSHPLAEPSVRVKSNTSDSPPNPRSPIFDFSTELGDQYASQPCTLFGNIAIEDQSTMSSDHSSDLSSLGGDEHGSLQHPATICDDTLTSIYADYSALSYGSTETSKSLNTVLDGVHRRSNGGKQGSLETDGFTSSFIDSLSSDISPISFDDLYDQPISGRSSEDSGRSRGNSIYQGGQIFKKVSLGFRRSLVPGHTRYSEDDPMKAVKTYPHSLPLSPQSDCAFSAEALPPVETSLRGLRPLRLSFLLCSESPSATSPFPPMNGSQNSLRSSISFATVQTRNSPAYKTLHPSRRTSIIPEHNEYSENTFSEAHSTPLSSLHLSHLTNFDEPHSAPLSRPAIWRSKNDDEEVTQGTLLTHDKDHEKLGNSNYQNILQVTPLSPHTAPVSHQSTTTRSATRALATLKPTLIFAIASDEVEQVRTVLERGDGNPNDAIGPQSALKFTLTNDQLANKMEIVKTLLAFGADPKPVIASEEDISFRRVADGSILSSHCDLLGTLDPAVSYYLKKADASHTRQTSALIHRSFFRPLTRVRYELVGQDRALEELFLVLSMYSRQLIVSPIVVLLCGPSGHGKSLLARRFGALLNVPTHTVNMTALDSTQDLWQSFSMSPYETLGTCTLAEFLINNEGKRCVVVLDEIEKAQDEKTLWSLLMPWELGRCTLEANGRAVDVRHVVWLGTSNIGHDLVFEHDAARACPEQVMSREEYVVLKGLLRSRLSERLGASILSRVTAVLPFVPFTLEERQAICYEVLHTIAADIIRTLSKDVVGKTVKSAMSDYIPMEGARSLYRAVSNKLFEIL